MFIYAQIASFQIKVKREGALTQNIVISYLVTYVLLTSITLRSRPHLNILMVDELFMFSSNSQEFSGAKS